LSNDFASENPIGTVNALNHPFSPYPLGNDLSAHFGNPLALPIVGNFDPPSKASPPAPAPTILADSIGVYRGSSFLMDMNGSGTWDSADGAYKFGKTTDDQIVGDWDGDGYDEIGVHRGNRFYLDVNGNGKWDSSVDVVRTFGMATDEAIIGDWNSDGVDDIGVRRGNRFYLDVDGNGKWDSSVDLVRTFGIATDKAIIGDWNADGVDEIGVHRGNRFFLDVNGNGKWDSSVDEVRTFGMATDAAIIGDWNADGVDEIGVHRGNRFYLDVNGNGKWDSSIDEAHTFGNATDEAIIGVWRPPAPLMVAGGASSDGIAGQLAPLTSTQLAPIVAAAIDLYADAGLSASQLETLNRVKVLVSDLEDSRLGEALGTTITIDINAAGHGWFIDVTPNAHEEFNSVGDGLLVAAGESAAYGQVDLLSVVLHELGHVLGLDDQHAGDAGSLMYESLDVSTRSLPSEGELAEMLMDRS